MTLEKLRYRKPCKECKTMLEFPTHKARSLGSLCFICKGLKRKARLRANNKIYNQGQEADARNYKQRKRYASDPKLRKQIRERNIRWRYANKDKKLAADKRYRESHKEEFNRKRLEYYHKNKDKVKQYPSQQADYKHNWYLAHKEELMQKQRERRAKRRAEKKV